MGNRFGHDFEKSPAVANFSQRTVADGKSSVQDILRVFPKSLSLPLDTLVQKTIKTDHDPPNRPLEFPAETLP